MSVASPVLVAVVQRRQWLGDSLILCSTELDPAEATAAINRLALAPRDLESARLRELALKIFRTVDEIPWSDYSP